jgi:uncharacterized Zn finger protein (UPF0148 family)
VKSYAINVCPECGAQEVDDREGDPVCPTHGWRVAWQEVEVIPRAVADELAADVESTWPGSFAVAKYREATDG